MSMDHCFRISGHGKFSGYPLHETRLELIVRQAGCGLSSRFAGTDLCWFLSYVPSDDHPGA